MIKRKDVVLVLFCTNCFHPNSISANVESILYLLGFYRCTQCNHRHYDLKPLVNFSKQTREYQ